MSAEAKGQSFEHLLVPMDVVDSLSSADSLIGFNQGVEGPSEDLSID